MDIGKLILVSLRRKAMTQVDLARRLDVTKQTVGQWIANKSQPSLSKFLKIVEILDIREFSSKDDNVDKIRLEKEVMESVYNEHIQREQDRSRALIEELTELKLEQKRKDNAIHPDLMRELYFLASKDEEFVNDLENFIEIYKRKKKLLHA